jgi:hypothetical protein
MRIERFLGAYIPELGQGISTEPNPRKENELGEQGKQQAQQATTPTHTKEPSASHKATRQTPKKPTRRDGAC